MGEMKVEWDTEELYPVYVLISAVGGRPEHTLEVSEEFKARYDHVMQEFWTMQNEVATLIGRN